MGKKMWETAAFILFSFFIYAEAQVVEGRMDRLCFTDPQVSQYCMGMDSYKYFFDDRTGHASMVNFCGCS